MLSPLILLGFEASHVLTILSLGLDAPLRESATLLREPRQLARVLLAMGLVMPVLAATAAALLSLPPVVKLVLMALAVSPVPPIILHRSHTERYYPLALFMTTCVLAPVLAPITFGIAAWALDKPVGFGPHHLLPHVALAIVAPLLVGWGLRRLVPAAQRAARAIAMVANVFLVGSTLAIVVLKWSSVVHLAGDGTFLALAAFTIVGLFAGHWLGGPSIERRAALAIATACRHPAIALEIAHSVFPEDTTAGTVIVGYALVSMVCAFPYLGWERQKKLALSATPGGAEILPERAP